MGLRKLSSTLPRKCYNTYLGTVTRIKFNAQHRQDELSIKFSLCVLFMITSVAFTYHCGGSLAFWRLQQSISLSPPVETTRLNNSNDTCPAVLLPKHSSCLKVSTNTHSIYLKDKSEKTTPSVTTSTTLKRSSKYHQFLLDNQVQWVSTTLKKSPDPSLCILKKTFFLSFTAGLFLIILHIRRTFTEQICLASPQAVTWQLLLFRFLPLRSLSKFMGRASDLYLPLPLRYIVFSIFIWLFKVKMYEAKETKLRCYTSLRNLFKRQINPDVRPIDPVHEMVSPVDGTVMYVGTVRNNQVEQVKGVQYSLQTFLGRGVLPKYGRSNDNTVLHTAVLYLSPGDYHHFHSPTNWSVHMYRYFPGELFTVSPWAVRTMPGLFALNERVLLSGQWQHGYFSLTAVGALNVGSIYLDSYQELQTNVTTHYKYNTYTDKRLGKVGEKLVKGQHVGGFNFGSTVVLLFEAPSSFKFRVQSGERMKYGEPLGTIDNI